MIHFAVAGLVLSLVCVALWGAYPLISGEGFDGFALAGSAAAVVTSATLVGAVVRWRL